MRILTLIRNVGVLNFRILNAGETKILASGSDSFRYNECSTERPGAFTRLCCYSNKITKKPPI